METLPFPECCVCRDVFTAQTWQSKRTWPNCIHYVCKRCGDRIGVACPLCRGGSLPGSRDRDTLYPLVSVINSRTPPKDDRGLTLADAKKQGVQSEQQWMAYAKLHLVHPQMTQRALENPDCLGNRHVYTIRACDLHGSFVSRESNQHGCNNCAQSQRQSINLCDEPEQQPPQRTKRRRTSTSTYVNAGLADLTDGDSSSYGSLDDFVDDGSSLFPDEEAELDVLWEQQCDQWQAKDWEAYLNKK